MPSLPLPVPVGPGVDVEVHRAKPDGGHESRKVRVSRGNLCSDWFKVLCDESGHMALYKADRVKEPENRGAPQLCGMADHAAADGWKWGPAPAPAPKPAPAKPSAPSAK